MPFPDGEDSTVLCVYFLHANDEVYRPGLYLKSKHYLVP